MSHPSPTLSEQIFNHAMRFAAPFASEPGHTWAAIPTGALTHEACSVASDRFREWLAHSFHHEHGIFPSHHSLRHAVRILEAHARFSDRPREEVFTRIGWRGGDPLSPRSIAIDLANPAREVVEITAQGWRITDSAGWRFRSGPGSRPLPRPTPGSLTPRLLDSLATLTSGQSASNLCRLATWLFAALRPSGPYPVLILTGPPSSGKTTIALVLRNLLDPAASPLHALPSTERDLFFLCLHNRVLAFDHVPRLTREVSIALARAAAGTAFAHHGQHPLDYSLNFAVERPVIVTVPYADSTAADWTRNHTISNLAITVHLDAIAAEHMRPRPQILQDLEAARPHIMAGLCNAATAALSDPHHWIASAAPALGLTLDDVNSALSADPLIRALTALLETDGVWTGTATELQTILETNAIPDLPATPKGLSQRLHSTPLAIFGIHLGHRIAGGNRLLRLSMTHRISDASQDPELCVMN
jgi:putative DNA primase/helicase